MRRGFAALLTLALALFPAFPVRAAAGVPAAVPTRQTLLLDGGAVSGAEIYNIDGANYFRLRDVALLLSGTDARFAVDYDEAARAVRVTPGRDYVPGGGELTPGPDMSATCVPSNQTVTVGGRPAALTAYNLGGSNFFRLRDLGDCLGFGVDYDEETAAMLVFSHPFVSVRLGNSPLYIRLPGNYAARETGGYEVPGTGLSFDVFHESGFSDARSVLETEAGGAEVTEGDVNGVGAAFRVLPGELAVALDAGDGSFEKLVFHLTGAAETEDVEARRVLRSLRRMLVLPLGDSPLTVAAPAAFAAEEVTDAAGGQTAACADAAGQRYIDLYLHTYYGSFDAFASQCAAAYGGRARGQRFKTNRCPLAVFWVKVFILRT